MPASTWGSFTPPMPPETLAPSAQAPTVPSGGASAVGGDPIAAQMLDLIGGTSPQVPITSEDIKASYTPISGGHAGAVPSNFATPLKPFQPMPFDTRPVVGAGNARARGIGNAITGATNAIGAFMGKQQEIKQNNLRDLATKVIQSQQAIDEAQQQVEMATQTGDTAGVAKWTQQVEQNKQTRDAIFAGKYGKDLAKGFNFSYTDPSANKTEYHAAVQDAIKGAKTAQQRKEAVQALQQKLATQRGQAMGAAYAKSQPQGYAANTLAQAKVALAQQYAKDRVDIMKTALPALLRGQYALKAEDVKGVVELQKAHDAYMQKEADRQAAFNDKIRYLDYKQASDLMKLRAETPILVGREKALLDMRDADPQTILKNSQEAAKEWQSSIAQWEQRVNGAVQNQAYVNSLGKQATQAQKDAAAAQVQATQFGLADAKNNQEYYMGIHNAQLKAVGFSEIQDLVPPVPGEKDGTGTGAKSDAVPPDSKLNYDYNSALQNAISNLE